MRASNYDSLNLWGELFLCVFVSLFYMVHLINAPAYIQMTNLGLGRHLLTTKNASELTC